MVVGRAIASNDDRATHHFLHRLQTCATVIKEKANAWLLSMFLHMCAQRPYYNITVYPCQYRILTGVFQVG